MAGGDVTQGRAEISAAMADSRGLLWAAAVFSGFVNTLMLTGPIFMLQVYDRVLVSRSIETLAALCLLAMFLFGAMAILDIARGKVMSRYAARLQTRLDGRVFLAAINGSGADNIDPGGKTALGDLEAMQKVLSASVVLSAMDLPWVPLFLAAIFVFHPLMGWLALFGGAVLVGAAWAQQHLTRAAVLHASAASMQAEYRASQFRMERDLIRAHGMQAASLENWQKLRRVALIAGITAADTSGAINAFTRTFRLFLQSAMLALGAWLTVQGQLSGGAMVASSVILGRALAPLEGLIGGWPLAQRALKGRKRLTAFLIDSPQERVRTSLPAPRAPLEVRGLSVTSCPGAPTVLRQVSFRLEPGQIMGVVGPSGAGKSTLVRALTGAMAAAGGTIRLGGATLDQYSSESLGAAIGYLPQRVTLFEGTIAANIARLSTLPDCERVLHAARLAGAHDLITGLADGYDTLVSPMTPGCLSGGQVQRIGLARAFFGSPAVWILDEPDASLDAEGVCALVAAIRKHRANNGAVLLTAHRQTLLRECDLILALDGGTQRAFGPRDEVFAVPRRTAGEPRQARAQIGAA